MSYSDNINRWQEYAKSKGWSKAVYPTPHDWLLKRMGLECPPAIFWSPWINGVLSGVFFGILFGIMAAIFHWYQWRNLGVRSWEEFVQKIKTNEKRIFASQRAMKEKLEYLFYIIIELSSVEIPIIGFK